MNIPRSRLLWAVSLGHTTNDFFMGVGPVTITFLAAHILNIGPAQIGIAISVRELFGAVSQPFFGWLCDRTGGRIQAAFGVIWLAAMMLLTVALAALTKQFWLTVIPYALSALGSGAFHPVGAMYASEVDQKQAASNTAWFFLLGNLGLAVGPILAGFLLEHTIHPDTAITLSSLIPFFALAFVVMPGVAFMTSMVPMRRLKPILPIKPETASTDVVPSQLAPSAFLLLTLIITLRSIAHLSTASFLPALFAHKGWEPTAYGLITSLFWLTSAVCGVIFGRLADRYDLRRVMALSLVGATPVLFFLPLADGPLALLLAVAAGGLTGASFPLVVVLVHRLFPANKGFASGAILGYIFTTGALGTLAVGFLADGPIPGVSTGGIGLNASLQIVAGLALVASVLVLALPASMSGRQTEPFEPLAVEMVASGEG
ncbi:MAG: MFS transporter [Chloroflexota bacterium]